MSGVFRNIDHPPPHRPASVYPPSPPLVRGGGHTYWVMRGRGVKSWEDARHCSVLYICKYFVHEAYERMLENETYAKAYRQR
jgi:hypothetical protein